MANKEGKINPPVPEDQTNTQGETPDSSSETAETPQVEEKKKESFLARAKKFWQESATGKSLRGEHISGEEWKQTGKGEKSLLLAAKGADITSSVLGPRFLVRAPDRILKLYCSNKEIGRITDIRKEEKSLRKELEKKGTSEERKTEINSRLSELGLGEKEDRAGRINNRMFQVEEKINQSKYLSPEKREKLLKKLGGIKGQWLTNQDLVETKMFKEVEGALKEHVGERTKKMELISDTLNLAGTATGAFAFRAAGMGAMGIARRYSGLKEQKPEGEKVKIIKDLIVGGVKETAQEMFGQGKLKEVKGFRKGVGILSAWGKASQAFFIANAGLSEFTEKGGHLLEASAQHIPERINDIKQAWGQVSNPGELIHAVSTTLNLQETFHRMTSLPRLGLNILKGEHAPVVEVPGGGRMNAEELFKSVGSGRITPEELQQIAGQLRESVEPDELRRIVEAGHLTPEQAAAVFQAAQVAPEMEINPAETFTTDHPSLEHAGFHPEASGGKLKLSIELGKGGAPRYLEQVYDRLAVDNMDLRDSITNVEGSRMLNVAANLTKLTEGHDVAGVSAEDFQKFASFEGGRLVISDYQGFKTNILDRLTGHSQEIITSGNVANSGAVAHLDNISQSTWEDIAQPEGISAKGIQFDHQMIDAAEARLFQSTLDQSGLGKIATDIHFTSESSGTFNLLDQQIVVDHGHVVSIGGNKLEHPLDFGNKQAGDKVLVETASRMKIEFTKSEFRPMQTDFEAKMELTGRISKEGIKALDDLEKDVTRLINTGNHGQKTLGLTLEQIRSPKGQDLLKETLEADGGKVSRANNIQKEIIKILNNSEGVSQKQTLAHFLEHHTDEAAVKSAVTGFKPEIAPSGMVPGEETPGADQLEPFRRGGAGETTIENQPGQETPPPPTEGGDKPPAAPPPSEAPTPEGEVVKTFTTPEDYTAKFHYGKNGEVTGTDVTGFYKGTPEFLREDITDSAVRDAARQIDLHRKILISMETQGKGNTPEANFLRQLIQKTIQDTEAQHGDVFKDVSLTPPAEQAHISPGGVVETGVQATPADIDLGETSLAASLGVEELSVETIKNVNDLDSLAKLKEGAEKALESLRTSPDPKISADTLESARRGIEYILKEVIDKRIAELKG